jgi:hypothetical protein
MGRTKRVQAYWIFEAAAMHNTPSTSWNQRLRDFTAV